MCCKQHVYGHFDISPYEIVVWISLQTHDIIPHFLQKSNTFFEKTFQKGKYSIIIFLYVLLQTSTSKIIELN